MQPPAPPPAYGYPPPYPLPAPQPSPGIARPPRWRDDLSPLFILILVFGLVGVLILSAGAVEFLVFEPLNQHSGLRVHIQGVYAYDSNSHSTNGSPSDHFRQTQAFAAVVDWNSIPSDTQVSARWFNGFGIDVGGVGPESAGDMERNHDTIPVLVPKGLDKNLPGHYLFVVERYRNGRALEVIGREIVLVQRG